MSYNELLKKQNKKAIVIVAHPDDETIWMGACLLKCKNIDWTIFSLCRASDKDRAPKFKKVCDYYGSKCLMSDLDDEDKLNMQEAEQEAENLILANIKSEKYDYIFSHGENGEYGHKRHIAVHEAVKKIIKEEIIKPEAVFYFCYEKDKEDKNKLLERDDANLTVDLNREEYAKKRKIVSEMYGYPMDGVDVAYCTNPEAFYVDV